MDPCVVYEDLRLEFADFSRVCVSVLGGGVECKQ